MSLVRTSFDYARYDATRYLMEVNTVVKVIEQKRLMVRTSSGIGFSEEWKNQYIKVLIELGARGKNVRRKVEIYEEENKYGIQLEVIHKQKQPEDMHKKHDIIWRDTL